MTESKHVAEASSATRKMALELGFSTFAATRLATAVSELARNAVVHGGGGEVTLEVVQGPRGKGLSLTVHDRGPGIADLARALQDGYSTAGSLGLGLGGARRLLGTIDVQSGDRGGTTIRGTAWV